MDDLVITDIYVYPIKSLGGISLQQAEVQQTGLQYDRRWMLTDEKYNFLSQRTHPQMVFLQVEIKSNCLVVSHKNGTGAPLAIPFDLQITSEVTVTIWDDVCKAVEVSAYANDWFSDVLKSPIKLVYMPAASHRLVGRDYAKSGEIVSFADAFPMLMIGQSSLDDLNSRLAQPLPMKRFRPNIVFSGGAPYFEDTIHTFKTSGITFTAAKPCARCVITTIDTELATKGAEPLKTLSTYRSSKNKILFGQNLLYDRGGIIKVGEKLLVQELKQGRI